MAAAGITMHYMQQFIAGLKSRHEDVRLKAARDLHHYVCRHCPPRSLTVANAPFHFAGDFRVEGSLAGGCSQVCWWSEPPHIRHGVQLRRQREKGGHSGHCEPPARRCWQHQRKNESFCQLLEESTAITRCGRHGTSSQSRWSTHTGMFHLFSISLFISYWFMKIFLWAQHCLVFKTICFDRQGIWWNLRSDVLLVTRKKTI